MEAFDINANKNFTRDAAKPTRSPNLRLAYSSEKTPRANRSQPSHQNLRLIPQQNKLSPSSDFLKEENEEKNDFSQEREVVYASSLLENRRLRSQFKKSGQQEKELQQENSQKRSLNQKTKVPSNENDKLKNTRRMSKFLRNPVNQLLTLLGQIQILDIMFIFPFILAMLKDLADLVIIGSFPAIGTVISLCCSIMIGIFMLFLATGKRKKIKAMFSGPLKRSIVLFLGTIVELVFGINFLPIETAMTVTIYIMVLFERKENDESGTREYY